MVSVAVAWGDTEGVMLRIGLIPVVVATLALRCQAMVAMTSLCVSTVGYCFGGAPEVL